MKFAHDDESLYHDRVRIVFEVSKYAEIGVEVTELQLVRLISDLQEVRAKYFVDESVDAD